jgi:N-acetylglucosamine kinase
MYYGLDIGGTKIETALFDRQFNKLVDWRIPTPSHDYPSFLSAIVEVVEEADRRSQERGGINIALPGFFDAQGRALVSNIPCLRTQKLVSDLEHELQRSVRVFNDVNAFVVSESTAGASANYRNVVGIVLGTGVGGGLCINGALYQSRQHVACEFGHLPVPQTLLDRHGLAPRHCGCGLVGCFNEYISGSGLGWLSEQSGLGYADSRMLVEKMRQGDVSAQDVFAIYIDVLGAFGAQLTLTLDPDIVVLGGGLSAVQEIYQMLPDAIARHLMQGIEPPPVVPPKFGDASGARGAVILGHPH